MGTRCSTAATRISKYLNDPPLVTTDNYSSENANVTSRSTDMTGYAHRMITLDSRVFAKQKGFSQLEYEGGMPMSEIQGAVQYLNSVYNRDGICQPLIGTIMRFDRADDGTLISGNHVRQGLNQGDPMVHLEFVEFWGYDINQETFDNFIDAPYHEIISHLADNYNFNPHWGKNDEWVFSHPSIKARNAADRATFNAQIAKLDPYGVFMNDFFRTADLQRLMTVRILPPRFTATVRRKIVMETASVTVLIPISITLTACMLALMTWALAMAFSPTATVTRRMTGTK